MERDEPKVTFISNVSEEKNNKLFRASNMNGS